MPFALDILIPTFSRPSALAVTLTSLCAQRPLSFRVVISDQTDDDDVFGHGEVQAALRLLQAQGHAPRLHHHLPRRGMAEQRQFLLEQSRAPYVLYLDDDVIVEPGVVARMLDTLKSEACGFVGCAVVGLSHLNDVRPHEQAIEFWNGPVRPERIEPGSPQWDRHKLHNAANLYHVARQHGLHNDAPRTYRVAWVGGCVLYDAGKLKTVGGYTFWRQLPPQHCGEDVLAQLRVMARFGGCGLIPSGTYHQELQTTISERPIDAPWVLPS